MNSTLELHTPCTGWMFIAVCEDSHTENFFWIFKKPQHLHGLLKDKILSKILE